MKICFIRHENVVKDVVIQSVQQNLTNIFATYSVLITYCTYVQCIKNYSVSSSSLFFTTATRQTPLIFTELTESVRKCYLIRHNIECFKTSIYKNITYINYMLTISSVHSKHY
jgi:hypothetical protein